MPSAWPSACRSPKPANILLDEDGHAYLADFGIAKDLRAGDAAGPTQAGAIVGSPEYLSPEQIKDEPVTPQTDIYSLGVLLYETLGGVHPFADLPPAERLYKQLHASFPPLQALRPDLPAALNEVIQRATAKQPPDRYPDVVSMVVDWQQASAPGHALASVGAPTPTAPVLTPVVGDGGAAPGAPSVVAADTVTMTDLATVENPYKGLRAFTEADAADFFGREALTQQLLEQLAEPGVRGQESGGGGIEATDIPGADPRPPTPDPRFLAVVGPSGSGKSSVVRAGLIPALRQGGLPGSERWFVVELFPGAHPLEELEAALLRIAVNPPESLLGQLREDERGLARAVKRTLPADPETELVLVIDQFEELWTLTPDEDSRAHVLASLHAAVTDPRSRVRVVVTLRADFIDRPLLHADVGTLLQECTAFVLPLTPAELERAIAGPAQRVGLVLEPGLVAAIVHDVGEQPGTLPLLQYALTELFERRQGRMLTHAAYQASGGVLGALARRAEELYASLNGEQQEVARQLFLRLVTPGEGVEDTRRRVRLSEIGDWRLEIGHPATISNLQSPISTVLERYGRARLLTFDRDPITREPTVEVAHEALIRSWDRLHAWLDASREELRVQRRLAAAAAEWANAGQDPSFLASGARLAQFAILAEAGAPSTSSGRGLALNAEETAYLQASVAERDRQELAERERQAHELELARQSATAQRSAANRLRYLVGALAIFLIVVIGLTAFALNSRADAVAQRQQAVTNLTRSEAQRLAAEANTLLQARDNPEAIALLSIRSLRTQYTPQGDAVLAAATALNYPRQIFVGHTDWVADVTFSSDGKYILTGSADKTARLWDAQTGQALRSFTGHTGGVVGVAYSPDGRHVLTGSADKTARLWDAQTGQELRQFTGHTTRVFGVAFSPDGRYVVTSGSDPDTTARLWDAQTGTQLRVLSGHTDGLHSVTYSPDGRYILTNSFDKTARLWDAQTGAQLQVFKLPDGLLTAAFSPDGRYILRGGLDKTAQLWDIQTGQQLRQFIGHTDAVHDVAFSPDGKYVLTASADRTARLWDAQTGQELRRFIGHTGVVHSVAYSPDGRYIVTAGGDIARLWDADYHDTSRSLCARLLRDFSDDERAQYSIADKEPTCPKP